MGTHRNIKCPFFLKGQKRIFRFQGAADFGLRPGLCTIIGSSIVLRRLKPAATWLEVGISNRSRQDIQDKIS